MRPPTPRQRMYLDFIARFTEEHGYAPTRREIGDALGVASTNGVTDQLECLRRKGLVAWEPNKARTLRLVA